MSLIKPINQRDEIPISKQSDKKYKVVTVGENYQYSLSLAIETLI